MDLLLLADYANTTRDNKLNVMGIFNQIYSTTFPASHPEMFIVAKFSADPSEYGGKRHLTIKLLDEDANLIANLLERDLEIPRAQASREAEIQQILRITGLVFPKPGTYQFSILVDNDFKGSRTVRLYQITKPQGS